VANKLDWSGTGELLGVENQDGLILYVAEGLAVDARVLAGDPMSILDISADTQLMASTSDMTTVSLRNIETGEVVQEIDTGEPIYNAVFSPDGERIYVASIDVIAADAYNATTGEHLQRYTGFETAAPVYHIEISANGQQLMWISRATVQLMDIETAELGPEFGHEDWANSVRLSPDGSLLAVATAATIDGEYQPIVQLWDAASGESAGQLLTGGEDAIASALDFTPDGQLLAVGAGGSIQFWNVAEQALVSTVAAHEDRINSLAFSPSGTTLASSSSDNMLKLWQVASP
jgi:WD40 repeat protein